jgi:S1-C subfamily serine protease
VTPRGDLAEDEKSTIGDTRRRRTGSGPRSASDRVPAEKLPPILIGASREFQFGQKVFAIGNPFGLDFTLTTGIVSAPSIAKYQRTSSLLRSSARASSASPT